MGLRVVDDMSCLRNKTLVDFHFSENENILYLRDKKGKEERVRISAGLKAAFEKFSELIWS